MTKYIPQIEPWIDSRELDELASVIKSTYITEHAKTEEFLRGIRDLTRSPHAIATSNGTLALVAALLASGIGDGDEVIVPDLTFIASSNAVLLVGAHPVFCDVERSTGCLDIHAAERCITNKTKAIMPVHLYGQMVDMERLARLAQHHGLVVIEDAAEALGMSFSGHHAGTMGRFGIFSFFANKTITCGEGGVVLAQNEEDYKRLYRIKNHGRDRKGIFVHESIGYNFCFTDLQAAVGVAQLAKFHEILRRKAKIFELYKKHLAGIEGLELVRPPNEVVSNHWFINILVSDPEKLSDYMHNKNIGTRRYFYPLHLQPCYKDLEQNKCENSLWLYEHGLSLPSGVLLSSEDIERVCSSIGEFFGG